MLGIDKKVICSSLITQCCKILHSNENRLSDNDIHTFVFVLFVVSEQSENYEETCKIIA